MLREGNRYKNFIVMARRVRIFTVSNDYIGKNITIGEIYSEKRMCNGLIKQDFYVIYSILERYVTVPILAIFKKLF